METLQLIRTQVSPLMDIDFFLIESNFGAAYDGNQIAVIIKGLVYSRTVQRIQEFDARCKQTLASLAERVDQTAAEFNSLIAQSKREDPGSAPSTFLLNRNDAASVDQHNEKVNRYNNQLELHRRIIDQVSRAKERHEDAVSKFNEKRADLEEQLREKMEELKPAMDQDILNLLGKLQQLAYDYISNKNNLFGGFLLGYLTKKVYMFLYDRINGTFNQRSATDIFKKISDETELILAQNKQEVDEGLYATVKFLFSCFDTNRLHLEQINCSLHELPYQHCLDHEPEAKRLLGLPVKQDFIYKHLIDPAEINVMQEKVVADKGRLENAIQLIWDFAAEQAPVFEQIAAVKRSTALELAQMNQTKTKILDPVARDLYFAIRIFDEEDQERYMNKHKPWLQSVKKHIEEAFSLPNGLTELVQTIIQTELLTLTADKTIQSDKAFLFLANQACLTQTRQELLNAVQALNGIIEQLNELPRQRTEEFSKKIALLLNLSLLPLCNIGVLFPVNVLFNKYKSGLRSQNPFYAELRKKQNRKLRLYFYIHLVLAISSVAVFFAVGASDYRFMCLGGAVTYLTTAAVIYFKKKRL